jgi:hypothetical protein
LIKEMIIGVSLAIMLILTLLSVVLGNDFIGSVIDTDIDGGSIVNGSSSTFSLTPSSSTFAIDSIQGAIAIILVIVVLATVIGIRIVASGLSDSSIKIITMGTTYFGLWALLSVLASSFIFAIETFGSLIYIVLTIVYVIGVVQKGISGGGQDSI